MSLSRKADRIDHWISGVCWVVLAVVVGGSVYVYRAIKGRSP